MAEAAVQVPEEPPVPPEPPVAVEPPVDTEPRVDTEPPADVVPPVEELRPDSEGAAAAWTFRGGAAIESGRFVPGRAMNSGGSSRLDAIRKSHTWTQGINQSVLGSNSIGVAAADTLVEQEFVDMNGDGLPDVVTDSGVQYNLGCKNEFSQDHLVLEGPENCAGAFSETNSAFEVNGGVAHAKTRIAKLGTGFGQGGSIDTTDAKLSAGRATQGGVRVLFNGSFNAGMNYGQTSTSRTLADLNGDGLTDYVRWSPSDANPRVRLNLGYKLAPEVAWDLDTRSSVSGSASERIGEFAQGAVLQPLAGMAGALGLFDAVNPDSPYFSDTSSHSIGGAVGGGIGNGAFGVSGGASMGYVHSVRREMAMFVDLTGDGLADYVQKFPAQGDSETSPIVIHPNLGGRFGPAEIWQVPSWAFGGSNLMSAPLSKLGYGDNPAVLDVLGFERSEDYQVTGTFGVCWFFVCVMGSVTDTDSSAHGELALSDVNGDGFQDFVLKRKGDSAIYAKLNQLAGANLLERIDGPLGGSIDIEYGRQGNTAEDGGSHFVMAAVNVSDGSTTYRDEFEYHQSGVYDRDEREFFTFSSVTVTRNDGSKVEFEHHNEDFFRKGLPTRVLLVDAERGPLLSKTFEYEAPENVTPITSWHHPAERQRSVGFHEGQTGPRKSIQEYREWAPNHGGLVKLTQHGDEFSADDLIYEIDYDTWGLDGADADALYAVRASYIVAKGTGGEAWRERELTFDAQTAAARTVTEILTGGTQPGGANIYFRTPVTTLIEDRDQYGNVTSVVDPNGYRLTYAYDSALHTHVTQTTDSFGYVSSSAPDYRYGVPASVTDVNGHKTTYVYDEYGRMSRVIGPSDQGTNVPTVAYGYALPLEVAQTPGPANPLWAKTSRKDVFRNPSNTPLSSHDFIETVAFMDGLGRVIQTKQELERDVAGTLEHGMAVSGTVRFDPLGRVHQVGQPGFSTGPATQYTPLGTPTRPTMTEYDALGRVTRTTAPYDAPDGTIGAAVTEVSYGFMADRGRIMRLRTTVADPLGNVKTVLRDTNGRVVETHESNDLPGSENAHLVTSYEYTTLGEVRNVTDPGGNVTRATYDTLGRMLTLTSPDMGLIKWQYDLGGNVREKETAQLRAKSQKVVYQYDFNRLARIDYPETTDKVFVYGSASEAGDAHGNVAGRIKRETSEAGTRTLAYDRQGNTAEVGMSFHRIREPHLGDYQAKVQYEYDAFGRLLKTRFPAVVNLVSGGQQVIGANDETVTYAYDAGGNLQSVFGQNRVVNPQHPDETPHTDYVVHIGYNEFGQKVRYVAGNFVETKYEYQPGSRRLAKVDTDYRSAFMRQQNQPARGMQRLRYDYDRVGNITQIRNEAPWAGQPAGNVQVSTTTQTFTYDDLYQLRTATGRTQSNGFVRHRYHLEQEYDELGNITLKDQSSFQESFANGSWRDDYPLRDQTYRSRYSYDGEQPHTPSQIDERLPNESVDFSRVFTYDASGNQERTVYRGSDRRELVWNEEDQITRVIRNGQELNQTRYDAQGQKAVHLHRVSGQEETAYLGPHLTIQDGRYVTKHVFVGSERVASKVDPDWFQSPPTLYFHPDHLGSTQYSTQDNQDLVQHDEYFPTGELWQEDTDSRYELARRYTFTGKELDLHTGLYDFGARRYEARQGQWLSPDPAFDGLNLYGYVRNNPVNLVDPFGLSAETRTWTEHDRQDGTMNGAPAAFGVSVRGPGPGLDESLDIGGSLNPMAESCNGVCEDARVAMSRLGPGGREAADDHHRQWVLESGAQALESPWYDPVQLLVPGGLGKGAAAAAVGVVGLRLGSRVGATWGTRAATAADLGLSKAVLQELRGVVSNAGSSRVISVEMIRGTIPPSELRGALGRIVESARADGIRTLQIEATFANESLQRFAATAAERLGGTVSAVGSRDTITFLLGGM